ncbi:MAG: hypothetical protein JSS86_00135 [Cyanobacteria bacterium SZAS LIN-2]|nr:hypothetical protein [Cyanobacteria bacterium SZAS LIN-2]
MTAAAAASPVRLLVRFLVVAAALLSVTWIGEEAIIRPLLPLLRGALELTQSTFVVRRLTIQKVDGANAVVVDADLAHAEYFSGRLWNPLSDRHGGGGAIHVRIRIGEVIQYFVFVAICILAWPAGSYTVIKRRLSIGLPLGLVLVLLNFAITVQADLWHILEGTDHLTIDGPLLWGRFLMGGGGLMIAICIAVVAVHLAARRAVGHHDGAATASDRATS